MDLPRIGVLRGGESTEYFDSLETGKAVINALYASGKYIPVDILIDRDGIWHIHGKPIEPTDIVHKVDAVFNALHGRHGEDGKIARFLDTLGIPHTSSNPFASAVTFNKAQAKELAKRIGLKTAQYVTIDGGFYLEEEVPDAAVFYARMIHQKIPPPWVVKPLYGNLSHELHYANSLPRLVDILSHLLPKGLDLIVEEYIEGEECSVCMLEGFRKEGHYLTPPLKIFRHGKLLYKDMKRDSLYRLTPLKSNHQFPHDKIKEFIIQSGVGHYAKIDLIVNQKGVYFLEVNDLPELRQESVFMKTLEHVGDEISSFIHRTIERVLHKKK